MIGPFLMIMGVMLFWIAVRNKSDPFLNVLNIDAMRIQESILTSIGDFMLKDVWNPMVKSIQDGIDTAFQNAKIGISGGNVTFTPGTSTSPPTITNPDPTKPPLQIYG